MPRPAGSRGENGLLVMFSCNTCPYVVKNQSRTREIMEYAKKNGLGVIIINSNEDIPQGEIFEELVRRFGEPLKYEPAKGMHQHHNDHGAMQHD